MEKYFVRFATIACVWVAWTRRGSIQPQGGNCNAVAECSELCSSLTAAEIRIQAERRVGELNCSEEAERWF